MPHLSSILSPPNLASVRSSTSLRHIAGQTRNHSLRNVQWWLILVPGQLLEHSQCSDKSAATWVSKPRMWLLCQSDTTGSHGGHDWTRKLACPEVESRVEVGAAAQAAWETPLSAHFRRSTPDGRRCRGPKGRGSRCEAARAASRFGGQFREDVLKCTTAPGFGREGDPSSPSFSPGPRLSSPPLLLPFFPFSAPAAARGPKGAVASSRWPTIGYFFTPSLPLTMISHSPSTP
jgi:hypothetical protein